MRRGSESRDSWNASDPVEIVATLHDFPPAVRDTYGTLLTPQQRAAIIAALRHCQGMGHPLPLTEAETDALCVRLGDQQ